MSIITKTKEALTPTLSAPPKKWRWYHGLAFYILVQFLTFGLSALTSIISGNRGKDLREDIFGDVSYFRSLKQSIITPPAWVFGPAWTINNISTIWGALQVLNKPRGTPGRDEYLALQAATWLNFVLFNAAYFSLRSPINAFVLTLTFFLLTVASGVVALFQLKDTKVALSLATVFVWLIIALTAGACQALWNHDDLYNVGPFVEPNRALVKQAK
jgi:tryptophan-rich sensory protein